MKKRSDKQRASETTNEDKPPPFRSEIGEREALATMTKIAPILSNAVVLKEFSAGTVGDLATDAVFASLCKSVGRSVNTDLSELEALLASQAFALNAIFTDLASQSAANIKGGFIEAGEAFLKLAFKAQSNSRATVETLSAIKNPPVVYARQANISNGPQQVNNGPPPATRTEKSEIAPSKQLETGNEQPLDTGTAGKAGGSDSALEAVGKVNGAKVT